MPQMTREEALAHFGIKGMRWGVRKSPNSLAKAQSKMDKLDANKAIAGISYQGHYLRKMANKELRKNPKFSYSKLTPQEKKDWQTKGSNKAIRSMATMGIIETALVLTGGSMLVNKALPRPETRVGAQVGVVLLAGQAGRIRVSQINAVRTAQKMDSLRTEIDALKKTQN